MNRRFVLKWLHWVGFSVLLYFFFVEPDENRADPGGALSTHAGAGLILALITTVWMGMYIRKGLMGRPGPKLPSWGKRFHFLSHWALQWGLPIVVASGAIAGLAAPFAIRAFGVVPINPAAGTNGLHGFAEEIHEIAFDGFMILIGFHIAFHVWRHFWLKDNALRIMVPKILHRYLR
ncbi:cytochrome b [Cochlodiniinecator piscidefendens]|uniref:cytochrome b n=1 Tax=Cochlodiniinecator piscidefendens TaxID=2715756 RepID=UPI00140E6B00|nr:cytochrome b/b6 domain-containing protein [Cochlodiniinecator piscidefendens]